MTRWAPWGRASHRRTKPPGYCRKAARPKDKTKADPRRGTEEAPRSASRGPRNKAPGEDRSAGREVNNRAPRKVENDKKKRDPQLKRPPARGQCDADEHLAKSGSWGGEGVGKQGGARGETLIIWRIQGGRVSRPPSQRLCLTAELRISRERGTNGSQGW